MRFPRSGGETLRIYENIIEKPFPFAPAIQVRQCSQSGTGGKTRLARISKRGGGYPPIARRRNLDRADPMQGGEGVAVD
jgi:hypothetical protein